MHRYPHHRWYAVPVAVAMSLALAACGSTPGGGSAQKSGAVTSQADSSTPSEVPASPSTDESPTEAVTLRGNAATNPACKLLSVDQVATIAGLPVVGILGLATDPAQHSESCTWYLEPKYLQSSLVVQYTLHPQPPTSLKAYYKDVIRQGYGKAVPKLGDVAKIFGNVGPVVDAVYRRAEIHVTVLVHPEATAEDRAAAIQLTRLVMAGIKQ
ncbi:MAG TPA: hypothetical protein VIM01_17905 [Dermatophilaceae bacterium]